MSKRFTHITPAKVTFRGGEPFSEAFQDVYFSSKDGLEESQLVFLQGNHLEARFKALKEGQVFTLAELGFGTGLNCLLAWRLFIKHAPSGARLKIYTTEKHPLSRHDFAACLKLWPELKDEARLLIESYPVLTPGIHTLQFAKGRVTIHLMLGEALDGLDGLLSSGDAELEKQAPNHIEAWFLDGFAPSKNQDMWSSELFNIMALLSKPSTTVASFSVAGDVRRGLEEVGFAVEKKPGFGHKRHRLEAMFVGAKVQRLKKRYTPWHVADTKSVTDVAIVGAGLAGCFVAYELAQRGLKVRLYDKHEAVGMGASGNTQGILFPNLSAYEAPLTSWMLHAFLYAARTYKPWIDAGLVPGALNGILQLNTKKKSHFESLKPFLAQYPELGTVLDAKEASNHAGIPIDTEALFVPLAGWANMQALCEYLIGHPNITFIGNTSIETLDDIKASHVVLACGGGLKHFQQTSDLPLASFAGQMTAIAATQSSGKLKLPLCGDGHVLPTNAEGLHWLGATYHKGEEINITKDNLSNIHMLQYMPVHAKFSNKAQNHWSGVRVKTPDYLPLVGPVPNQAGFLSTYQDLALDGGKYVGKIAAYYPGLYVCAGFGSRGLTSIPLAAYCTATLICDKILPLPRKLAQSVSPARYLMKELTRVSKGV